MHGMKLRETPGKKGMLAAIGFLLTGAIAGPACNAGEEPAKAVDEAPVAGASYLVGAAKIQDARNDVVLELPEGWSAVVPRLGQGSITLASYDMSRMEREDSAHNSHRLLASRAKVDLTALSPEEGRTMDQWVQRRLSELRGLDPNGASALLTPTTGDLIVYRLARRDGYAYKVQQGIETALEIVLPWEDGKVLLASIVPADSQKLRDVLPVLDQLRTQAEERASQGHFESRSGDELMAPLSALPPLFQQFGACSGWTGSDSGSIAPNTPIQLNLPFYVGTWWRSGGAGSFWGNGYHGNCNNDYYAIDFNRVDSACSAYLEDAGQNVYPVSGGTAYVYWNSTNGYGNYVDVVHASGIKTRYAHLQSINVGNGAAVGTQTVIGYVGTTGNSSSPHLHFGFYQNGYSHCASSTGYCPNGELASSPQSARPSPMNTYNGSKTVSDFGCYQAPP
jgi:hypothetical protein